MSSDFILEFHDVYKSYDDLSGTKLVLNDIDLQVRKGEFITLLGPSGCGKSTMLRLILGSEKPSKGTVMIDGLPAEGPSRDRGGRPSAAGTGNLRHWSCEWLLRRWMGPPTRPWCRITGCDIRR